MTENTQDTEKEIYKLPEALDENEKIEFRFDGLVNKKALFIAKWYEPVEIMIGDKKRKVTEPTSSGFKIRITRKVGIDSKKKTPFDYYEAKIDDYGWYKEDFIAVDRDNEAVEPKLVNHIGHIIEERFKCIKEAANAAVTWLVEMEKAHKKIAA